MLVTSCNAGSVYRASDSIGVFTSAAGQQLAAQSGQPPLWTKERLVGELGERGGFFMKILKTGEVRRGGGGGGWCFCLFNP